MKSSQWMLTPPTNERF